MPTRKLVECLNDWELGEDWVRLTSPLGNGAAALWWEREAVWVCHFSMSVFSHQKKSSPKSREAVGSAAGDTDASLHRSLGAFARSKYHGAACCQVHSRFASPAIPPHRALSRPFTVLLWMRLFSTCLSLGQKFPFPQARDSCRDNGFS